MKLNHTTAVPNIFFDKQIGELSGSAIRVYLKIVRNLLGWRDQNGQVKKRDWIAHSQFEKTGLSNRSVTNGIQELLEKQLIQATDYIGNDVSNPKERKHAQRVYYSLILENSEKTTFYNEKTKEKPPHNLRTTKEISLPKYKANERIPDHIRIRQIQEQEQRKQLQRDSWQ
ncbi:hypothetical protein GCM10011344_27080 [Dokdonia pacifica]|uniref:Phage replication protein O n=1 Tax=Dokdonia pacifica TaxID=1627892 RepID=A0A239E6L6_9FLAO|nr:hypothetical protein [Dokdonia pacifica]GGG25004.1 hypothetical protein GCM10011344_27080 [Dokdonia pacifica]SNS40390.1 hypothetical protein SAMN06265376_11436 [Dokdonia pacifica]